MATENIDIDYTKYDFKDSTEMYVHLSKKGLSKETVIEISKMKNEPQWMLDFRIRSYEVFMEKPMPLGVEILVLLISKISTIMLKHQIKPKRIGMMFQIMSKIPLINLEFRRLKRNFWQALVHNMNLKLFIIV